MASYAIGPTIGVARLGNSPSEFYLGPESAGGLPIACDTQGNIERDGGIPRLVTTFKDAAGCIKRQGALFRVFRIDDAHPLGVEVTLASPRVKSITWTVHVANKKAAWYNFSELDGNLLYPNNSYEQKNVPLRNVDVTGPDARRKLIIDPGPRTLAGANLSADFDANAGGYPFVSFPPPVTQGEQIQSLGGMRTDSEGRLVVLGGFGKSGGDESIGSFAGADTWHDDISDGPVSCVVEFHDGTSVALKAWVLVGSPKFVPEIVNISTLEDTMYDTAVRNLRADPEVFNNGSYNPDYVANFERDIRPILDRPGAYRWVANVPSMNSMSPPGFDPRDKSDATVRLRQAYLGMFRAPGPQDEIDPSHNQLFSSNNFPMMPLNSGSNSVSDDLIDKFATLTATQQFFLGQWAAGNFTTDPPPPYSEPDRLTRANLANCVGNPFCPGIEVTWSTRNPNLYDAPLSLRHRHDEIWYAAHGLDPTEDETDGVFGLEPGDLTKRMAIPWQADFFQCSIQFINFTDPTVNKSPDGIPAPPTYFAYWWPPQSPWQVITGDLTAEAQTLAGTPAGYQVLYARGINTFAQMITGWSYLGFIVNQTTGSLREYFPYLVEQERAHEKFVAAAVAVGDASNVITGADTNFANAWFLTPTAGPVQGAAKSTESDEQRPVRTTFAASRSRGRIAGPHDA